MGAARAMWDAAKHPHGEHGHWASTGSAGRHRAVNRMKVDREGERRAFNRDVKHVRSGTKVRQQKAAVTGKVRKIVGPQVGTDVKNSYGISPEGYRYMIPVVVSQRRSRKLHASSAKSSVGLGGGSYKAQRKTKTTFAGKKMRVR